MKISLAMIAFNEEDRIRPALGSAQGIVDEIIVVDSGSLDRTRDIAAEFGARVVCRPFVDYASQKNLALQQATGDWVLNLDADERVSDELKAEILLLRSGPEPGQAGFRIRRRTRYLGRWIRHSGWYPERKLRLFRRQAARWEGRVHERLVLNGACGDLDGEILHYTYRDISDHVSRINRYSAIQSEDIARSPKKLLLLRALLLPPITFLRHYLWRLGFLDGFPGLVIALVSSWGTSLKYLKARTKRKTA